MTIQTELQRAKFKGVSFLFLSSSITGGRKTVTHEYPNKNTRFSEDLGKLDKTFSIDATVSNLNYKQNRDALINILESQGAGELVHPTLGTVTVQVSTYTLNEDISDLGNAKFSINFERTEPNIFPLQAINNEPTINSKSESLFLRIKDNISNTYKSVTGRFASFNDAKDKVLDYVDKAHSVAANLRQIAANINEFANSINGIIQDVNSLVTAPAQLAASINNVLVQGQTLFEQPNDVLAYYQGLFGYGDDDSSISLITEDRIFRQENRDVLNSNIKVGALTGAYQSVINLEFLTTDDIEGTRTILEDQYLLIIEDQNVDFDTKEALQDLRNEVEVFLRDQEKVSSNITEFRVYNEPVTALVYRLYGDLTRTEDIIDINSFDNVSFIEGDINILSES